MEKGNDMVVISEDRETAEKLEQKLNKKEKFYNGLMIAGKTLANFGTPVFVGSLVSPFDFDGPIIEIVSGVLMVGGNILKFVSKEKLKEIKAMKTNGEDYSIIDDDYDPQEVEKIGGILAQLRAKAEEKKALKEEKTLA